MKIQCNHHAGDDRLGHTKVVDAEGKPLRVYHGTTSDFDTFTNRPNGLFFTDDVAEAARYGRVVEACLALENPIVIDARGTFWNERDTLDSPAMDELRRYGRILVLDHLKAAAEKAGYDGVIVRNVVDNHGAGNQYIAFRPDQVMSVAESGLVNYRVTDTDGQPLVVFHGTDASFDTFQAGDEGGIFFTTDRQAAEGYGDRVLSVHLAAQSLYEVTAEQWSKGDGLSPAEAKAAGYDGYVIRHHDAHVEPAGKGVVTDQGDTYIVFDPDRIRIVDGGLADACDEPDETLLETPFTLRC